MDDICGTENRFAVTMGDIPATQSGGSSDQCFLMIFIVGTYFGPDLIHEVPRKAALERTALKLPPYSLDELGGSVVRLTEIESVYYYVLRKAHWSVRVKPQSLYKFFQGQFTSVDAGSVDNEQQFTTLFPPSFHMQTRYRGAYKVVENLVFLHDPEISYIKPDDMNRFKHLTGLHELKLDREEARLFRHGLRMERNEERRANIYGQNGGAFMSCNPESEPRKRGRPRKNLLDSQGRPLKSPLNSDAFPINEGKSGRMSPDRFGPAMLLLSSALSLEQWNNIVRAARPSIAFTGTAAARQVGPLVGLVDIGASEDSYLFRIALPGVKKDERDFSCEVESDGKVVIRGITTTGESIVVKNSRVFHMQSQTLCPPGPFTVSFQLPGPVEPREFSGIFGSDGILEGIVMKDRTNASRLTFES
eukprot:TRINITY_DN1885_c1_g1_i1.p1 TRINITY_DN1885_c1_g1~~TRINITY_DN1885_c1_g1_i1.p1  ORF type:complete len:418 (-),score=76.84 TRINITY_DN1885_c1_g1_i1:17-1270(-)